MKQLQTHTEGWSLWFWHLHRFARERNGPELLVFLHWGLSVIIHCWHHLYTLTTTCTRTNTRAYTCTPAQLLTFQALPSPSRVCGVSFVTVMSSSERCQRKESRGTVDEIQWSSVFQTKAVFLCHCPILHLCVHVLCVYAGGGAISQIYGNWNGRIFWGKCSQFDSAAKKVTLFNLHSMAYEVRQGNTWKQTILSRPRRLHHLPTA